MPQAFRYCYDFLTLDFLQKFCTPWVDITVLHLRYDQQILATIQRSAVPLINHERELCILIKSAFSSYFQHLVRNYLYPYEDYGYVQGT